MNVDQGQGNFDSRYCDHVKALYYYHSYAQELAFGVEIRYPVHVLETV